MKLIEDLAPIPYRNNVIGDRMIFLYVEKNAPIPYRNNVMK